MKALKLSDNELSTLKEAIEIAYNQVSEDADYWLRISKKLAKYNETLTLLERIEKLQFKINKL